MQLNKYIAQTGIASRRKAELLIENREITVNSEIVTDCGYRVKPTDKVKYKDEILKEQKKVYLLLNKPKGYITTVSDEKNRRTVMELIDPRVKERLYPIGRLDRNTTGLLILTNDGEFALKLSHPSHKVEKVYIVTLDKNFIQKDFTKLLEGIKLVDGYMKPDSLYYLEKKNILKISLHSGKNRIVRRAFEFFGYKVKSLDRALYGGITKKGLKAGVSRVLTEQEISLLSKQQ